MTVASAKEQPVHLVLSGPAGGVIGAAALGKILGHENLITIDMGGTSLDASLIAGGQAKVETSSSSRPSPCRSRRSTSTRSAPAAAASRGSTRAGTSRSGRRAQAPFPGRSATGRAATRRRSPTRRWRSATSDPENFLGGEIPLDPGLTKAAIAELADGLGISADETAAGILRITNAKIAGAVRVISIERGYHPRDFSILGFGGARRVRRAEVARELAIPTTIIPPGPATFSAFGMLMTDVTNDFGQTAIMPLEAASVDTANEVLARLASSGRRRSRRTACPRRAGCSCRRPRCATRAGAHGQRPACHATAEADDVAGILEQFGAIHHQQYGHSMDDPVEIVTLRMRTVGLLPRPDVPTIAAGDGDASGARSAAGRSTGPTRGHVDYAVYDRPKLRASDSLEGPAIVEEPSSTTVIHAGDVLTVGEHGELVIRWA